MKNAASCSLLVVLPAALALASCSTCEPPEAGEGPRLLTTDGTDPCPQPLMPLIEGAHWRYKLGAPAAGNQRDAELRVLEVTRKSSSLSAKVRRTVGSSVTTVEATCSAEGSSFLALFVPLGPPLPVSFNYAPTITKREGVLLLPLSRLRAGAQWTYKLVSHTERPGGKALTMDSNWDIEVSHLGEQSVVVPAGRYNVRQIKLVVAGHHRPPAEEDVVFTDRLMDPPPMTFTYSLAAGVGIVLIEGEPSAEGPQQAVRWELASVDRAR